MALKKKKTFNVLEFNYFTKTIKSYDVLPYFRNCWKHKNNKANREKIKDKNTLQEWIEDESRYMFWAKCEYEFLMASWPFGSHKMIEKMKEFLSKDYNLDNYSDNIDFLNIILQDMEKIDFHKQIMMNIDIITDILFDEFKIKKDS